MVEAIWKPRFLATEDFGGAKQMQCRIVSVTPETGSKGKPELMCLFGYGPKNATQRRMSLWGDNIKSLIDEFGNETDDWTGKAFLLTLQEQNGKMLKVLHAIPLETK